MKLFVNLSTALWAICFLALPVALLAQEDIAQDSGEEAEPAVFDVAVQLESFDKVWDTIKNVHWEPERVGENWDAAREKFRPQVENAADIQTVRTAMEELLATLEQSHFGIIPQEAFDDVDEEQQDAGDGTSGLEIRLIEDQLVVTRVFAGLPADESGVQPGWQVKLIGNRTADEILLGAEKLAEHSVMRKETAVGLICDARTAGTVDEDLAYAFVDHEDNIQLLYLKQTKAPGTNEKFGHLPAFNVDFQSQLLSYDVGYIGFNAFIGVSRLSSEFKDAVNEYSDKKGLIIDMRGNRGGIIGLVAGMCGWFAESKDPIGKMQMSGGKEIRLALNPRKPRFEKPIAVLIDSCSISSAEIMSGGLQDLGLARVFGSTSAGLVLPSTVAKLPNGDRFQYAISGYLSASGESLEGIGVIPDEKIDLTKEMLSKGDDPVLEAAKKWILEQQ